MKKIKFKVFYENKMCEVIELNFIKEKIQIYCGFSTKEIEEKELFIFDYRTIDLNGIKLLQYINRKDTNDVEIYEGHIIEICYYTYWEPHCTATFLVEANGTLRFLRGNVLQNSYCEEWTIVGDMFTNPELINRNLDEQSQ